MGKKSDPDTVLQGWLERDLTAEADVDRLPPAFEVEDVLRTMTDVLNSGRHPILAGESGVGKTSVVYELARRMHQGIGPEPLRGKRILQFSLRNRMSSLLKPEHMRPEMQSLVNALLSRDDVVPFFRDIHLAYEFDLEPQLQLLAIRSRNPILAEADARQLESMMEGSPELEQSYVPIGMEEPDLPTARRILEQWAEHQKSRGRQYAPEALEEALQLTYRFLARSRLPRKAIDFIATVGTMVEQGRSVAASDVIDRFHQTYRVPRMLIDPAAPFDIDATEKLFGSKVLGQPEAVRAVVRMIGMIKAGLSDARRPFGSFLFVGPTGVGKTHIAQLLADFLFGSRDRMIRLNMADYPSENDPAVLFGDPNAYAPRQRRGVLTARVSGHPFAVLLLDEFEKAHPKVHDRFLQLIDEGSFINGAGETISCRSLIIIATSNAGAEVYRGTSIGFSQQPDLEQMDQELDRKLYEHFRIEFLNRFDQVVHFHPLGRQEIRTIASREIEALRNRNGLKARGISLEVDDAILDWLAVHGYDPHFGARFLRRTIERNVTTSLAEAMVRETVEKGSTLALGVRANRVDARAIEPAAHVPKTETVRRRFGASEKVSSLDRKQLDAHAGELVRRAAPLIARLEEARTQASDLLAVMNQQGFWDQPASAQQILDQYRELDLTLAAWSRLAEPLLELPEQIEQLRQRPAHLPVLARAVERADESLAQWEERLAQEGVAAVWILLRNADPLEPAADWLEELVAMYQAWGRRLRLACSLVAYGTTDDTLSRAALEVEGPGAGFYLSMEQGIHRLHKGERHLRVRVDVITRGDKQSASRRRTTPVKHRIGLLGLPISCSGRIEREERAPALEFFATDRDALELLLSDLDRELDCLGEASATVRSYGQAGVGGRDPRTGATVARYKDVLKGRLDPFLDGWHALKRGEDTIE
ncbi:MAG: AAA family ATPase [Deltaproteobacteria bacterium]|nr:AAA family ATPase [Deltaproteobacteria bacterium]